MSEGIDEAIDGMEKVIDPVRGSRIALKAAAIFVVASSLIAAIGFSGRMVGIWGAAAETKAEADGAAREAEVVNEAWFAKKAAEINAAARDVESAKEAFARKKGEAESRWVSRDDDRAMLDALNEKIMQLEGKRAALILEWDSKKLAHGDAAGIWSGS